MSFLIAPFPGQTYAPRYASHHDIRAYLGLGELVQRTLPSMGDEPYVTLKTKKLPLSFTTAVYNVPLVDGRTTTLYAYPSEALDLPKGVKSSAHRVHADCPDCGELVPAGRTHQHKCK